MPDAHVNGCRVLTYLLDTEGLAFYSSCHHGNRRYQEELYLKHQTEINLNLSKESISLVTD